jgi:2-polyprenyl-6-methoxyphenol hydroxylase-like FAD-dependent oxidoreductase
MLETALRARALALPNVRRRDDAAVSDLVANNSGDGVTGVRINGETLAADLVVDASGRGSRSPQWLAKLGYESPRVDTVQIELGYTTRLFRRVPTHLGGDLGAVITRTPKRKRGGVMLAQEDDRWIVTLTSCFGNYAPEELGGFIEFARTLEAPDIYDVVRQAEPLGDGISARFPASIRKRYELLTRFPKGFLVTGDAICSFNPVYGQGMSVAALEALELEATLREGTADLARRFFLRAQKVVDIPWGTAVANDLRMPEVPGERAAGLRFANWYVSKLHKAGHWDPACALAFLKVSNLMEPPASVMKPRMMARVLFRNLAPHRVHSGTKEANREQRDRIGNMTEAA